MIKELDKLDRSVIFSISADAETLASWRAYIETTGADTMETVVEAMREYMARHPLTPEQMETYNDMMSDLSWTKNWVAYRTWCLRARSKRRGGEGGREAGSGRGGRQRGV